jgi:hypothetical protein
MTHCTEEDLILRYYGEDAGRATVEPHLASCGDCARRFRELSDVLQAVAVADVPERDDEYGQQVWRRIRDRLPERERPWLAWLQWKPLAAAVAASLLVAIGFVAGRTWSVPELPVAGTGTVAGAGADAMSQARRVLLLSAADHLERSDRLLTDVVNAADGYDMSQQQEWAEDLLWASRLYRQDALAADERALAALLDETERALLEIVHGPSTASAAQLEDLRLRVDSAALLFKVRVMRDELLREDRLPPGETAAQTHKTS